MELSVYEETKMPNYEHHLNKPHKTCITGDIWKILVLFPNTFHFF